MQEPIEFYNYAGMERRLEKKLISNPAVSRRNKRLILDFLEWQESRSISKGRRYKKAFLLTKIATMIDKDFGRARMRDFERLMVKINRMKSETTGRDASAWYKCDARTTLKLLIKYLKGEAYNPQAFEWIRTSLKSNEKKTRVEEGHVLTADEVEAMIRADDSVRNKALMALAYESAARPSEILSLRLSNVSFDSFGAVVHIVQSKTKPRPIRVISGAPYLKAWINVHPFRDDPASPLWIASQGGLSKSKVLGLRAYHSILSRNAERAGVKKTVYPYLLRHSRITHLAQSYPDQIVKRITGHTPTSKHYEVYLHMSNKDVDAAILHAHGLLRPEDEQKKDLEAPVRCWNCRAFNSIGAKLCEQCNFALDFSNVAALMADLKKLGPIIKHLSEMQAATDERLMEAHRIERFRGRLRRKL